MKKIVSVLLAVLMVSTLSVTAFAQETKAPKAKDRAGVLSAKLEEIQAKADEANQKREKFATKQEEWNEFRVSLNEKRTEMLNNKIKIISLKKDILNLRLEISNSLAALKESGTKLTDDQLASITALKTKTKEILDALKETRGDIKTLMDSNKENVKAQDFAAVDTVFAKVYEIQEFRITQLTNVKDYLLQISDMLK